jgi:hippurate hydrolase
LLDGIRRIAAGEAMASGIPQDLMPVVTVEDPYTRATFNSPDMTKELLDYLAVQMGADRVTATKPVMGGEDFGEFRRADEAKIKSVIFWVGGQPASAIEAAKQGTKTLPALHSALWAPEAGKVIGSGAEVLILTAMHLMPKAQ